MMQERILFGVLLLFGVLFARPCLSSAASVLSLDGNQWTAVNSNKSIKVWATVPGGVYTDLVRSAVIGDPYFRFNDVDYRWVALDDWTYSRSFNVSEDYVGKERVVLKFDGLDTIADVFLNGKHMGSTSNMFVRYEFDAKNILQVGVNTLEVKFQSAVRYAKKKYSEHLRKYLVPPTCPLPVQHGECHANFVRKIQSSFSWDWGPAFPSQGIWKKTEIEAYSGVVIRDITVFTNLDSSGNESIWNLDVNVFVERSNISTSGNVQIKMENFVLASQTVKFQGNTSLETSFTVHVSIPPSMKIGLWWPSGYGSQKLYNLSVTFTDKRTSETSIATKRIGFRTVELVQENVTQSGVFGQTFYFRINGVPVFAKGSNLIPLDSFPERVTPGYIRWLMQSTVDANMNMLRIWGGGMYENDVVYDLADELGILLWQDLMFACALYPVEDDFLKSVTTEVTQQIRRLQTHPSVFVWTGNNENEEAITQGWWPAVWIKTRQYEADYVTLYVTTISAVVGKEDPTRTFLTSSPSNDLPFERAGHIDGNPNNELYGDVHYYNYLRDGWQWTTYPRPRFASEYGFQAYPSFESLANVSVASDWTYPVSSFLQHRQHHMFGNLEIDGSIARHFHLPKITGGKKSFLDFLYLSQVVQAMSVKTETEHYRRSRSDLVDGKGLTMGALYWQLNDIWQGASWASIEYGGKWKMLHYFAREFFSPVLASPYIDGNEVKVSIVSDLTRAIKLILNVTVYEWSSFTPKLNNSTRFIQAAQSAQVIFNWSIKDLLQSAGCKRKKQCFVYVRLFSETNQILSTNFLIFTEFKSATVLSKANIQIKDVQQDESRRFRVVLETDRIAPFVWVDVPGVLGTFSANGFMMVEPTVFLNFTSTRNLSLAELRQKLTVQSLMDAQ